MTKGVKIFVMSDIHYGHKRNDAVDISAGITALMFENREKIIECDMIIITGDLYDALLTLSSSAARVVFQFMDKIFKLAKKFDIKVRLLEGTPSHDMGQGGIISSMIQMVDFSVDNIDFKYFNTIEIENVLGLTILYVPDEIAENEAAVEQEILVKLSEHNLKQVDLVMMHGTFGYQLPVKGLPFTKSEDFYLGITKYYIVVGHVHKFSTYKDIIAPGSIDRLAHNEEDPKGGVIIHLHPTLPKRFEFIVNKHSMLFKTIQVNTTDVRKIESKIKRALQGHSKGHLRVFLPELMDGDVVKNIVTQYPMFTIKFETANQVETLTDSPDITAFNESFEITPVNITHLTKDEILLRYPDREDTDEILKLLENNV